MVCGILLLALIVAEFLYRVNRKNLTDEEQITQLFFQAHEEQALDYLSSYLVSSNFSYSALLDMAPYFSSLEGPHIKNELLSRLDASPLALNQSTWLKMYLNALASERGELPERFMAEAESGARWSNRILGDLLSKKLGAWEKAAEAYRKEGLHEEAEVSRKRYIGMLVQQKKLSSLESIQDDPLYSPFFDNDLHFTLAIFKQDWPQIIKRLPATQYAGVRLATLFQAGTVALVWLFLLMHMGQAPRRFGATTLLCLIGLFLGMLSTMPTIWAVIFEEDVLGFVERYDLIGGLIYCIGGIGLREEGIKLLFVIPLVPWLVRRNDPLEMLLVSACVGLGFAVEENIQYFDRSNNTAVSGRFLTANFLHLAGTGLTGYAFCQAWKNPRRWNEFFTVLGIVVVLHGLYDAFIMVPALLEYSLFSMTVFVLLAYQFFGLLHSLRETRSEPLSLTGHFLLGLSIISAVNIVYLGQFAGAMLALNILGNSLISLGVIVYMFIREFREEIE